MKAPKPEELPIQAEPKVIELQQVEVDAFQSALGSSAKEVPPTLGVKALTGMFQILNKLEVNWQKLLHVQQSFDYAQPIPIPSTVICRVELQRCRYRAGSHWLNFHTRIEDSSTGKLLGSSESLITVADEGRS